MPTSPLVDETEEKKPTEEIKKSEPVEEKPISNRRLSGMQQFQNAGRQVMDNLRQGEFSGILQEAQKIDVFMWKPVWKTATAIAVYIFAGALFLFSELNFTKRLCDFFFLAILTTGALNMMDVLKHVPYIHPQEIWFTKAQVDTVVGLVTGIVNEAWSSALDITLWKEPKQSGLVLGALVAARQLGLHSLPWVPILFLAGLSLFFVPYLHKPPDTAPEQVKKISKALNEHQKKFVDVAKKVVAQIPKHKEEADKKES
jgi:hypothetical protein